MKYAIISKMDAEKFGIDVSTHLITNTEEVVVNEKELPANSDIPLKSLDEIKLIINS